MVKLLMLLTLLLGPLVVCAGQKKHKHHHSGGEKSCAHKHGIVEKVKEGQLEQKDLRAYLRCLKRGKKDMAPAVVQFITGAAKDEGQGNETNINCEELIEADGCDANYGQQLKHLTGVEADITAGDLCAETCSQSGGGEEESCAQKHRIVKKVKTDNLKAKDLKAYLRCLKLGKKDMAPAVVQFITGAAKDEGQGNETNSNCEELIEADGCDANYSPQLKHLTGVEADITAGDLCAETCSGNSEDIEDKFELFAVSSQSMSSMSSGAAAAAMAATGLTAIAYVARAARRAAPPLVTDAGDQLLETGIE